MDQETVLGSEINLLKFWLSPNLHSGERCGEDSWKQVPRENHKDRLRWCKYCQEVNSRVIK